MILLYPVVPKNLCSFSFYLFFFLPVLFFDFIFSKAHNSLYSSTSPHPTLLSCIEPGTVGHITVYLHWWLEILFSPLLHPILFSCPLLVSIHLSLMELNQIVFNSSLHSNRLYHSDS